MINRIGNPLAKLIRDIAYTKGALKAADRSLGDLESRLEPLKVQYRQLQAQKRALQKHLATLEALLQQKTLDLSADEIRGIQSVPRTLGKPHGAFVAAIVSALKVVAGPIDTHTLVDIVAANLDMPVGTPTEYAQTKRAIRRKLCFLVVKGAVERLPNQFLGKGQKVGIWRWKGL